jgi:YebC/PmpR family DNA-binding regulatory protein
MAGHSKWSQIKHKKAKEDLKRGKSFTKLIKEITIAARLGGGDIAGNARLRFLVEKAKEINMPQENTTRAIKRGTGELPGMNYERYTYEGYGPGNIAIIIDVLTDNKNRAIADLRTLFNKKGGVIAENGAVSWMFDKVGVITITSQRLSEDQLIEHLLNYPVIDIKNENSFFKIICEAKSIEEVKQGLINQDIKIESADIEWIARDTLSLTPDYEDKAVDFLTELEDLDDVQNIYTNLA